MGVNVDNSMPVSASSQLENPQSVFGVIYKITNNINGKVYIGQTRQSLKQRWGQHRSYANRNTDRYLYKSMRAYGIDNFRIEIIDSASSPTELSEKEIIWIAKLDSFNSEKGYNATSGGELAYERTIESRALISERQKRRWLDPVYRESIGERTLRKAQKAAQERNSGKKRPTAVVEKVAAFHRARARSEEELNRLRTINIGRIQSADIVAHRMKVCKEVWARPEKRKHRQNTSRETYFKNADKIRAGLTPEVLKENAAKVHAWRRNLSAIDANNHKNKCADGIRAWFADPNNRAMDLKRRQSIWTPEKRAAHSIKMSQIRLAAEARKKGVL